MKAFRCGNFWAKGFFSESGHRHPPGRKEAGGQRGRRPSVREEIQELWYRTGHPAPERSEQVRQMAQVHPSPETEGCPPD